MMRRIKDWLRLSLYRQLIVGKVVSRRAKQPGKKAMRIRAVGRSGACCGGLMPFAVDLERVQYEANRSSATAPGLSDTEKAWTGDAVTGLRARVEKLEQAVSALKAKEDEREAWISLAAMTRPPSL